MVGLERLVDEHFATLGAIDQIQLAGFGSGILRPDRLTGTFVDRLVAFACRTLVSMNLARWWHINYFTFRELFRAIGQSVDNPIIVETGSSAYGTNSSMLFAALANATNGEFNTVDNNPATVERLRQALLARFGDHPRMKCHFDDSIAFIHKYSGTPNVVYLDSYDLEPGFFTESARHGLHEFEGLLPKLDQRLALILIDDTPARHEIFRKTREPKYMAAVDRHLASTGRLPGKGELIVEAIRGDRRFRILDWQYQLLLEFRN
jgi:hypothetical protein